MSDAQQHINDLTRPSKILIRFLPNWPSAAYTATAPSPLAQLRAAAASSTSGRGGRTIPGSRLPLNADAIDLWSEILLDVHGWAWALGINRRPYLEPPLTGDGNGLGDFTLPPTGRLLRATYAQAIAKGRAEQAERIGHRAGIWLGRIHTMLAGVDLDRRVYPLRDHPCEACGATVVTAERDGETYREPAVQAHMLIGDDEDPSGERWPYLVCLACGEHGWHIPRVLVASVAFLLIAAGRTGQTHTTDTDRAPVAPVEMIQEAA